MGTVYKARHRRMKRIVAIKVLASELSRNELFVKRFQREVETIACLGHPNVVMAYDADQAELGHFLVMEFVDGVDLAAYVGQHGPLSPAQAVDCLRQAACGLAYAHGQNIVHRDIKPHNLLRDHKGAIKVTDLGLARLTHETDGPAAHRRDHGRRRRDGHRRLHASRAGIRPPGRRSTGRYLQPGLHAALSPVGSGALRGADAHVGARQASRRRYSAAGRLADRSAAAAGAVVSADAGQTTRRPPGDHGRSDRRVEYDRRRVGARNLGALACCGWFRGGVGADVARAHDGRLGTALERDFAPAVQSGVDRDFDRRTFAGSDVHHQAVRRPAAIHGRRRGRHGGGRRRVGPSTKSRRS